VGQGGFRHVEEREDIRAEGALELRTSDLGDVVLGMLFGSIIDQDVELSKLTYGVLHDLLAEMFIAHIASHRDTAPAFFFHEGSGLLCVAMLAQVGDGHIGPFFGEGDGHSAADAAIAPGDEGDFAL
jgi:hypothetical protein